MKFVLEEQNGQLYLYSVDKNNYRDYCESRADFDDLVNYIKASKFKVLKSGNNLILKGINGAYSFKIRDANKILSYHECAMLKDVISYEITKHGATNITNNRNISKKHNHNNKYVGSKVKKVGLIVPILGVIIGAYLGISSIKANTVDNMVVPPDDYYTEYNQGDYAMNIEDLGSNSYEMIEYHELDRVDLTDNTPVNTDLIQSINLEYEDLSESEKAVSCKDNYYNIISNTSKKYGIDPKLMLCIATQERGEHSPVIDEGGGCGLMQVQYDVWLGETINSFKYNPDTGKYEDNYIMVTDDMIRDLEGNIELSCAIFQNCLNNSEYNIPLAIQMYNQGQGSIHEMLVDYCREAGKTYDEVLYNPSDLGWLKYTQHYLGDPEYLTNVLKWTDSNNFKCVNCETLQNVVCNINNTLNLSR